MVITGNPGVGKHTCAKIIAESTGSEIIDINKIAFANDAITKKTKYGLDVDVKKLGRLLVRLLEGKNDKIVVGHLAPYVLKPPGISMVAVLRMSPYELGKTLENRGYSHGKVKENLASEILGVSFYDSIKTFGKRKVVEFDATDKTPTQTANEIMCALRKKPKAPAVDWLAMVSEKDDMKRFFEY